MADDSIQPAGAPLPPRGPIQAYPHASGPDRDLRKPDGGISTLIPYNNPKALIAYYLGVFALIPCAGLLLGPPAFVLGILGLKYVKAHPTAKGTGHAIAGIVLGGLATLVNGAGLIGFLVMMFLNAR